MAYQSINPNTGKLGAKLRVQSGAGAAIGATWPRRAPSRPTARSRQTHELQPLSAINSVFERLAHGDVPSCVVLDFSKR